MVRYIGIMLLLIAAHANAAIEYNGATISAVKRYNSAWSEVTPKTYAGSTWLALISYDTYDYHFFAVLGQSNAQGFGSSFTSPDGTGGIEIKTSGSFVNPIDDPTGQAVGDFDASNTGSAWPAFCAEYYALTGKHPILLCLGAGASGLITDLLDSGCWNPTYTDDLYDQSVTYITEALADIAASPTYSNCLFKGIVWWQGETESATGTSASTYQTALQGLFDSYASDLSGYNFNWYCIQIKNLNTNDSYIRTGTTNFASAEARAFVGVDNPYPYSNNSDHHTQAEYDAIGEALAAFIAEN